MIINIYGSSEVGTKCFYYNLQKRFKKYIEYTFKNKDKFKNKLIDVY